MLIVDPGERSVHWLVPSGDEYREVEHSGLIELSPAVAARGGRRWRVKRRMVVYRDEESQPRSERELVV